MTAPPSVSIGDLERAYYLAAVPATDNNLAVTMGQGLVTMSAQAALQSSTKSNSATATAPTAGTAIVTVTIPSTGYYRCDVIVGFGATAESTAIDNFKFENNGGTVGTGACPVANVANTQSTYTFYAEGVGGNNFTVNAVSNASAGSVYKATIMITRMA